MPPQTSPRRRPGAPLLVCAALAVVLAALAGCIPVETTNPAITITPLDASAELTRLEHSTRPLARPVVILNGYHTPSTHIWALSANLARATSGNASDILEISYPFTSNFECLAREVVDEVNERWPSSDPDQTVEVDVVGVSMGGLVARWAALPPERRVRCGQPPESPPPTGRRLKIAHLFTLASPHRGANMAEYIRIDDAAADMRPGSAFLQTLDETLPSAEYELVCYAQQRDVTVGATRAAPPGREPIWTGGTILLSHMTIVENTIFLADIARRLRGEPPLVQPAGPPEKD